MYYKRQGIPEEDEIVLCKVTKIFPNSVFVDLLEYGHGGMVHISEIAPGRIRNLRDYVSDGRQIVCKVLRLDREKGHIDLSLRRVNSTQRVEKLEEIKQELKAEALVKNLAKKLQKPAEKIYQEIAGKVLKKYSHIYGCFQDVVAGVVDLEKLGLEKSLAKEVTTAVLDKFKPPKIMLQGEVTLQSYQPDGVERIKTTLQKIELVSPTLTITYLGGGKYKLVVEDLDYKPAEKTLAKAEEIIMSFNDKFSVASLSREKKDV